MCSRKWNTTFGERVDPHKLRSLFNHKKRYKGFPWDGDEVRFPKDLKYFLEYDRLLKKALPPNTPCTSFSEPTSVGHGGTV